VFSLKENLNHSIQKDAEIQDHTKVINSDQSFTIQSSHEAGESTESLKLQIISYSDSILKHQEVGYYHRVIKYFINISIP
jgi:hypothetical protein